MMIESKILKALQTAVLAAVAASIDPTLGVKPVGRIFDIPSNGKWLEIIYIPNNSADEFWSEGKTYQGILRLLVHWPTDDKGAYGPMEMAQSIAGYFTKGMTLDASGDTVRINEQPNMLGVMEMPPEMLVPISIRYQCFKAP